MDKVSIVIPVYNVEKYLSKCIDSVINQTYNNIEIILIDDGSTDGSSEICRFYKNKYKNIIYKKIKNQGVSHARNIGLKIVSGRFIIFIDSDDYIDNDSIELLVSNYKKHSLIGLIPSGFVYNKEYSSFEYFENVMTNKCLGSICGLLFENNLINFSFDENTFFMEDTIFLFNYLMQVKNVNYIDGVKYHYVVNDNSITKLYSIDKILSNIKSFNYSLDKIKAILLSVYFNKIDIINSFISHKKVKLVESELIKINKFKDLKKFVRSNDVKYILKNNDSFNVVLKFIKKNIINNNFLICYIYIIFRKVYLRIKNMFKL